MATNFKLENMGLFCIALPLLAAPFRIFRKGVVVNILTCHSLGEYCLVALHAALRYHSQWVRGDIQNKTGLPPLWLAYVADPSDSGKIHSTVRKQSLAGDEEVIHSPCASYG